MGHGLQGDDLQPVLLGLRFQKPAHDSKRIDPQMTFLCGSYVLRVGPFAILFKTSPAPNHTWGQTPCSAFGLLQRETLQKSPKGPAELGICIWKIGFSSPFASEVQALSMRSRTRRLLGSSVAAWDRRIWETRTHQPLVLISLIEPSSTERVLLRPGTK